MPSDLNSPSLPLALWDDNPSVRLGANKTCDSVAVKEHVISLKKDLPDQKWPFGMPTPINPYLLFIGVSPGAEKLGLSHDGYPSPNVGIHDGINGEAAYWKKVRLIAIHILKAKNPSFSNDDCLALVGQLNLGVKNEGKGGFEATDSKIRNWVPKVIPFLKPKIIITFGLRSLCLNSKIIEEWENTILAPLLKDGVRRDFGWNPSKRTYSFEKHQEKDPLIVSWPNHPSKHPFTNNKAVEAAALQFVNLFLET